MKQFNNVLKTALLALLVISSPLFGQEELLDISGEISVRRGGDGQSELQWYSIEVREGDYLSIEAISLDFTPYLEVISPSGLSSGIMGTGSQAAVTQFAFESGTMRIAVGYVDARSDGTGSFFLKVSRSSGNEALQPGQTRRGTLSSDLPVDSEAGRIVNWYPLAVSAGDRLQLILESGDFDAYLYIRYPDGQLRSWDDGDGSDSIAVLTFSQDQDLLVGASSFGGESRGSYFLTVEELGEPARLSASGITRGRLVGAPLYYSFVAPESGSFTIFMNSQEFDTVLRVTGPDGLELQDDDGGDGSNSVLSVNLEAGDEIIVEAASWGSGGGGFELLVSRPQTIALNEEIRGRLSGQTRYELSGNAGDFVVVELLSDDFDTYLSVTDSRGNSYFDDDSYLEEYIYASVLSYFFEEQGTITIGVSSFSGSGGGEYILRTRPSQLGSMEEYPDGYEIALDETITAAITGTEEIYDVGPGDLYSIYAEEGNQIRITMISEDLDTYLTLVAPNGQEFSNDDGLENLNSLLELIAPVTGVYQLVAQAFSNSIGAYEVSYSSGGRANIILQISGSIDSSDQRDIRGTRFDIEEIELVEGQSVSITVESDSFDTRLYINDPDGEAFLENDDYDGSNSRIDFTVEESGVYTLVVMPYYEEGRGEYLLQAVQW